MIDKEDMRDIEDDDFDYLKEIEEIEAQERALEDQRRKKKAELEKRREERARETKKSESRKKRELKEEKKEEEWLGKSAGDNVETVPVQKKNGKVAIILGIIVILILLAAGGIYGYKMQAEKKVVSDFEAKVTAFRSEKMNGVDFGSHQAYFDDFFVRCQEAIEAKDLAKIAELNTEWADVESQYAAVSDGQASLEAFLSEASTAFAKYSITDTYKETYDDLMKRIEDVKKSNDYTKIQELQKQIDALATNLKSDNMKLVQTLKNDISAMDLDGDYIKDDQKKQLAAYNEKVESAIKDGNYKQAVESLNGWKSSASAISSAITEQKRVEAAKAESEAAAIRESESKAAESRAEESKAQSESKEKETASTSANNNNNNNNNNNTSAKSDYVLPDSNSRYLTADDLKNLSSYQLMIARNEIYARRGRKFADAELRNYFNSKSWYHGTIAPENFSISVFNDYELKNIDLIQEYE